MDIGTFLVKATHELRLASIESARLDVLLLLEDETGMDRAQLLAHPEHILSPASLATMNKKCMQRKTHLPLAYLREKAFFYGREFIVTPAVLVPRPESESMIDLLLKLPLPPYPTIIDVGTGSGCLGITAALEVHNSHVILRDISPTALLIARKNSTHLSADTRCEHADLLENLDATDVLLANLPYVPENFPVNQAATHEPRIAIFAGSDGLDLYREFWQQVQQLTVEPAAIITESLENQHRALATMAKLAGYNLSQTQGLAQLFTRYPDKTTPRAQHPA